LHSLQNSHAASLAGMQYARYVFKVVVRKPLFPFGEQERSAATDCIDDAFHRVKGHTLQVSSFKFSAFLDGAIAALHSSNFQQDRVMVDAELDHMIRLRSSIKFGTWVLGEADDVFYGTHG